MIVLKKINKIYRNKKIVVQALKEISLTFPDTGLVCILGTSGSGKSTLLHILGGLDSATDGEVIVHSKSMKDFNEKEYAFYRNKEVGFIFQNFNLIEDYTVYENIILSLKLQNRKIDKMEVEELLQKLGIEKYKNRKPRELSGGQKGRVAIARALIKKPSMVLADEPTGNLDSKTGKDVMELLKWISKTTLVIVVTHNREHATIFADRIIEMEDGQVVKDTIPFKKDFTDSKKLQANKTKLPLSYAMKLGFKSLWKHKIRLFMSCLLLTFSSIFLMMSYSIQNYDIDRVHQVMLKDDISMTYIDKVHYTKKGGARGLPLKKKDVSIIEEKWMRDYDLMYEYTEGSVSVPFAKLFHLNVYLQEDFFQDKVEEPTSLYIDYHVSTKLRVTSDFSDFELIGRAPSSANEIVISNYLADLILEYGIYEYKKETVFYPESYEEIVSANKEFSFGSYNNCKIVGIFPYDMSSYESLKKYSSNDRNLPTEIFSLKNELQEKRSNLYNQIYVLPSFIQGIKTEKTTVVDSICNVFSIVRNGKEKDIHTIISILENHVSYYDGISWKERYDLKEGEVLLDIEEVLREEDFEEYYREKEAYLSKNQGEEERILLQDFLASYLKKKGYTNEELLIGEQIELSIYEDNFIFSDSKRDDKPSKIYSNVKVVGITVGKGSVVSKEIGTPYLEQSLYITGIKPKTNNLKELFHIFPYGGTYIVHSPFFQSLTGTKEEFTTYKEGIVILEIIFLLLSLLLIYNLIASSVQDRKRDIGIIRAMGSRKNDIQKIFFIEDIFIAFLTWCMSITIFSFFYPYLNYLEGLQIFFLSPKEYIYLFIYFLVGILLASFIPIRKILHKQIVDIIYDRN